MHGPPWSVREGREDQLGGVAALVTDNGHRSCHIHRQDRHGRNFYFRCPDGLRVGNKATAFTGYAIDSAALPEPGRHGGRVRAAGTDLAGFGLLGDRDLSGEVSRRGPALQYGPTQPQHTGVVVGLNVLGVDVSPSTSCRPLGIRDNTE